MSSSPGFQEQIDDLGKQIQELAKQNFELARQNRLHLRLISELATAQGFMPADYIEALKEFQETKCATPTD